MEKQNRHSLKIAGIKLAFLFLITIAVLVANTAIVVFVLFVISLIGLFASHISAVNLGRLFKISLLLILFAFIANIFVIDGTGDVRLFGTLGLTFAGFERAGLSVMRILTLVFSVFWLASFVSYEEVSLLFSRALKPLRALGANPKAIAEILSLAVLFLPLCLMQLQSLRTAHILRGAEMRKASVTARLSSFVSTFVSLIVVLFRKAHYRALALKSRGF